MTFSDDLKKFTEHVNTRSQEVFTGVVDLAHESIQTGSAVTGSPGQPVDTGALRASWQKSYPSATEALISTNLEYAPSIEDGISYSHGGIPMTLRSAVGGFHAVSQTRAAWQRVVDYVTKAVTGGG